MSPFESGVDVVCIDDAWGSVLTHGIMPVKNCIYKIKNLYMVGWKQVNEGWSLEEDPEGDLYLSLYECPPHNPPNPMLYSAEFFRPVKHTNIEIFRNLLVPTRDLELV